jgi:hypothetical protein
VLDALSEQSSEALAAGAIRVAAATYQFELRMLIHPQNGFHFAGTSASLGQLEDFSIARMGRKIQEVAPNLWQLLGDLLDADPSRVRHAPMSKDMSFEMDIDVEPSNIAAGVFGNDEGSDREDSDDEGSDVGGIGGSSDVEDGSAANSAGEDVTEGAATDTDGSRKRRYRKQNPARRNAILLFIVSVKFTCEMTTTYWSNRGELL